MHSAPTARRFEARTVLGKFQGVRPRQRRSRFEKPHFCCFNNIYAHAPPVKEKCKISVLASRANECFEPVANVRQSWRLMESLMSNLRI